MKYARKCSITGEGMNEGWEDESEQYFKYEKDVIAWLREVEFGTYDGQSDDLMLEEAVEHDVLYTNTKKLTEY